MALHSIRDVVVELFALIGREKHDIKQSIARVCVRGKLEVRPDMLGIHDFQQDVLTGQILSVQRHCQRLNWPVVEPLLQPSQAGFDS